MDEFKLSYTAQEINEKLGQVKEVPTKVSQLENDRGYITPEDLGPVMDLAQNVDGRLEKVEFAGYQTEAQVNALINAALGVIENGTY